MMLLDFADPMDLALRLLHLVRAGPEPAAPALRQCLGNLLIEIGYGGDCRRLAAEARRLLPRS